MGTCNENKYLVESPSATAPRFREALRDAPSLCQDSTLNSKLSLSTIISNALQRLMDYQKTLFGLGRLLGLSKQDAEKQAPSVQEEVDSAEPPTDPASTHNPFVVSPTLAKDIMRGLPDRSAENVANIVNDLALNDVSKPSPKSTAPRKRKRQEEDMVDRPPTRRLANGRGTNETTDEPLTASTNAISGHGGRSNRASSVVVKVAPAKLPRPKREQRRSHTVGSNLAGQQSGDMWDPAPSPTKQPPPTTTRGNPLNLELTPRPRGRPPRVGPAPPKKAVSIKNGQRRKSQGSKVKPPRKGRPRKYVSPEVKSGKRSEIPNEILPGKAGPKSRPRVSRTESEDDHMERARTARSTRSTAAANGYKDAILNANTDLTKMPERDARRAAKQRRSAAQASASTPVRASDGGQEDVARDFELSSRFQNQVVGEEHEQEERSERGKRGDAEEVTDNDYQASNHVDEGEEGGAEVEEEESDLEGPTQSIENDEVDEGEEELELFGQDEAWKTVIEGARSICGPKLPLNQMPKLKTETMRVLVKDVREARGLYEQLLPLKGQHHDPLDELNDQLGGSLNAIDDQVRKLSERTAATKSSDMIRDIYARAIPAMVFLLQSALVSRISHSEEPGDLNSLNSVVRDLEEIVRLQDMAILLCMKARAWEAKPVSTSRPVVKPTTQKMYPCLKVMRGAFAEKLSELRRRRKVKQNAVESTRRQIELDQSSQQASQEAPRKREIWLRQMQESREKEDEARRNEKRNFKQVKEDKARARMGSHQVTCHVESRTTWSYDEELELYTQLEKGYSPRLTCTSVHHKSPLVSSPFADYSAADERYLNMLNGPRLQNKLPQHIRERALYVKQFLLEEKGPLPWINSIE